MLAQSYSPEYSEIYTKSQRRERGGKDGQRRAEVKEKKRKEKDQGDRQRKSKAWRDRNGNWAQLKFRCGSPSKHGLDMVHSVLLLYFQWERDNEFKPLLHLTSLPDALAPLQLKSHTLNLPYICSGVLTMLAVSHPVFILH